jgi:uncharacterized membrane protein
MTDVDVMTSVRIARPRDAVASYTCEPANAPRWYRRISEVSVETGPPLQVGSRARFVARFLGRTLNYTYEIVEFEPGRRLVMRTAQGPFPMETTYTFADDGAEATRMELRNRGTPTGFSRLVAPLISRAVRRATAGDLARLKEMLERER